MIGEFTVSNEDLLLLEIATCLQVKKGKEFTRATIPLLHNEGVVVGEIIKGCALHNVKIDGEVLYDVTPLVSYVKCLLQNYTPFCTTFETDASNIVILWHIIPT